MTKPIAPDTLERLRLHIESLDAHGHGNTEPLAFDDLTAIHEALEANNRQLQLLASLLDEARPYVVGFVEDHGGKRTRKLVSRITGAIDEVRWVSIEGVGE